MKLVLKIVGSLVIILLLGLAVLAFMGGAILRKPVERYASKAMDREVHIGKLDLRLLNLAPGVHVGGLKIANPDWVGASGGVSSSMADVGDLTVAMHLLPLLHGKMVLASLDIDNANLDLRREAGGRANWTFGAKTSSTNPLTLPVIERLAVRNSRIRLQDALGKIAFDGEFATEEGDVKTGKPLGLHGKGSLNAQPFTLDLEGGSLASAVANRTYPFEMRVRHGATKITASGSFIRPLDFGDFTANLTLEGRNLADLYYLTGLALPSTRAYSLSMAVRRDGLVYRMTDLKGKLGGSDLSGNLLVDTRGARPLLTGDLHSSLLDPADAGVVFGGADGTKTPYILPDKPLELARLRGMDAKISYTAAAINVDKLPLKQVDLVLTLDNGKLILAPLAVTLPQGTVSGSLVIDASKDVPAMDIDVKMSGARLEDFMATAGQPNAIEGPIVARVKMKGAGRSFHDAAAVADGTAAVVVPHGQIRQAFAELLGINAAKGLGLLLSGDQKQIGLRCGVASFESKKGVLTAQHIVFDTDTVVAVGSGTITMADESMDLTLRGKPKEARLLRLMTPIKVGGTLKNPSLGVGVVQLGAQAGVATALGVVLTPLAAVLPFLDAGLAGDADCGQLKEDARDAGVKAPVQ